jgi:protein-S-isoprenylcysteine O-methyltransferase Ste14
MLQSRFWQVSEFSWRVAIAAILLLMAALLSWTATRALGRQLRFDAAIGTEHQLVRNGPYAVIRHPIYCSMLCLLWGIGALAAPAWLFLLATAIFLAGTEIRVRVEDRLLAQHFQGTFEQYRQSTRAYVPWIR